MHIAIIPDGNRRWAKERGLHPWEGHTKAVENFRELTEWCRKDSLVSVLTVWCFSTENWKRDRKEIDMLMEMLEKYLRKERDGFKKESTRFVHSGRRDRIPASVAELLTDVEEETKDFNGFTLHLAIDYGGKDEIIRAISRMIQNESVMVSPSNHDTLRRAQGDTSEKELRKHLDHPELPDIDLVLRTSGEIRTSNFFLWQTAYAEWIFLEKYFPDFTARDIEEGIKEFERRKRRFGA